MDQVEHTFVFVNLIDTDQLFGHRLEPDVSARSLKESDDALPSILSKIKVDDLLIITADYGNDLCAIFTDRSREFMPLLVYPKHNANQENLGTRGTFADVAASIADFFGVDFKSNGFSFTEN